MSPIQPKNLSHSLSELTRASKALPLGSYRQDIAYTGALKSTQALAMGSYRQDIAYTGALKSIQALAMGSYRQDIAYTGALKSIQTLPKGSYRQDIAYTGALKTAFSNDNLLHVKTGVLSTALTPVFCFKGELAA